MEGVEAVVVGEGDVGRVVQQQRQDVVTFFRHSVMQRRVPFMVLWGGETHISYDRP